MSLPLVYIVITSISIIAIALTYIKKHPKDNKDGEDTQKTLLHP